MASLLLGLVVFFAPHLFTIARGPRAALVGRLGEWGYKIAYSLVALAGFWLIVRGYGDYRAAGMIPVWDPPVAMRHVAALLTLPSFILLVAAYAPAGLIKSRAKHPMLAGVKLWALAHLLANGDLGSIVLFGAFLAYGVVDRIAVKRRAGLVLAAPRGWGLGDWFALGVGTAAWLAFALWLHRALIGVPVFR